MNKVLVLGAGKIGALISGLLAESGAYQVQLADVDETAAAGVARAHGAADHPAGAARRHRCRRPALASAAHPVAGGGLQPALSLQCAGRRGSARQRHPLF